MKIAQALLGVEAVALWWFNWSGHITIGWLLALATINGLITAFEIPARQSLVIELVGRDDLPGAIALNSSGFNLARIVGPSIGAIIIAKLGIAWCFGVNAASYIAVLVGLFLIQLPAWTPPEHLASPIEGIREGVRYMRDTPAISALMKLVTVFSVLGVPYLTLMPVVARDQLGLDAGGYGALLACVGIGGLTGALSLAAIGDRVVAEPAAARSPPSRTASCCSSFALVRTAALAYPMLFCVGFTMILNNAARELDASASRAERAPRPLDGRLLVRRRRTVAGGRLGPCRKRRPRDRRVWAIGGGAVIMLLYAYQAFVRRPGDSARSDRRVRDVLDLHFLPLEPRRQRRDRAFPGRTTTGVRCGARPAVGRLPKVRAVESHAARGALGGDRGVRAALLVDHASACRPTTSDSRAFATDSSSCASDRRCVRRWRRGATATSSADAGESI